MKEKIAVIDFGGQYAHLIANRIRRLNVYAEVLPSDSDFEIVQEFKGAIFSGGPSSVYSEEAPEFNDEILNISIPILGICYGHQLLSLKSGGRVRKGETHEFGPAQLFPNTEHQLFQDVSGSTKVWMSHGDEVKELPGGFKPIGQTSDCTNAAIANDGLRRYGIQFHPEVTHSEEGDQILDNFLKICGVEKKWDMKTYFNQLKERLLVQCEGKKVFLLVSGGVDSTVAFALLNQILGPERVKGLHIDNGLMRKNESQAIMEFLKKEGFHNLELCEAQEDFLSKLKDVAAPEKKRKIIGDTFLEVLNKEVASYNMDSDTWIMAQGTTYPDTIESGGTKNSATIKTHHNRVPKAMEMLEKGLIIEPLAELYKDEVRELGENLGIPHELVWRHPFPGPGLGVRLLCRAADDPLVEDELQNAYQNKIGHKNLTGEVIPIKSVGVQGDDRTYAHPGLVHELRDWELCELVTTQVTNQIRGINRMVLRINSVSDAPYIAIEAFCTPERIKILQEVDAICTDLLKSENLYDSIWQMPVVLLPITIEDKPVVVLRPIQSSEAMTANFTHIDFPILDSLWATLKKQGIGALWYDITHKPPGTIEWE